MSGDEAVAYAQETHRMALEANRRANDLYDLIFPPWRWLRWHSEYRAIKAMIREIKARRTVLHDAGFGNPAL